MTMFVPDLLVSSEREMGRHGEVRDDGEYPEANGCDWCWPTCIGVNGIGPLALVLAIVPLASGHCHRANAIGSLANKIIRIFSYYK